MMKLMKRSVAPHIFQYIIAAKIIHFIFSYRLLESILLRKFCGLILNIYRPGVTNVLNIVPGGADIIDVHIISVIIYQFFDCSDIRISWTQIVDLNFDGPISTQPVKKTILIYRYIR